MWLDFGTGQKSKIKSKYLGALKMAWGREGSELSFLVSSVLTSTQSR